MMRCLLLAAFGVAVLVTTATCGDAGFSCGEDVQCEANGEQGVCEQSGGCSFPDPTCDSGRRYGEHAPHGLGGQCVSVDGGSGDMETGAVSGTDGGDSTSAAGPGTTLAVTATTGSTGGDDAPPGTSSSEDGVGSSDTSTGGEPLAFFDPFDRPDGPVIGNGWIEKTAGAFRLLDEQVELDSVNGQNFRDNLFYRPLSESMLDVEASIVVNFTTDEPLGYPQLHLRVQSGDVATPGNLTSYAVFVDAADPLIPVLTVNRIDGPGFGPSDGVEIDPVPIDAETNRIRGRITGTDPVLVEGFFEEWDGATWQLRTQAMLQDGSNARIVDPGTVGAGGHLELQYFVLDDFGYMEL